MARDPVLQTVRTLRPSPEPPHPFTCWTSHSPPHFDISLFRPTSSSAIFLPSAIKSFAIVPASFPASVEAWIVFVNRRVAAPRLTAVGRAVYRKSKSGSTCAFRAIGEVRKSGGGDALRARSRCAEKDNAAREAMAGAPRI